MADHPTLQSPVLVGREEFLALAGRRLAAAADGQGYLLFVAGEAGIGKARLLAAIAAAATGRSFGVVRRQALLGEHQHQRGVRRPPAGWRDHPLLSGPFRNQRCPNGSRNTATRPAGGLSSGPRSIGVPATTTRDAASSQSSTDRCSVTALPRSGSGASHGDLRMLVGHHPAGSPDRQFDVTDPAVRHPNGLEGHLGAQRRGVPVDRGTCVAHAR